MATSDTGSDFLNERIHEKAEIDDDEQRQEGVGDFHPVK
jgi:hypothetical protein